MEKGSIFTVLVFMFAFSRLVYLSADPPNFIPSSVIGDEGYWAHNARLHAIFGHAFTDDFVEDVNVAPFLSLLLWISFAFFGVGFWQARLVPAMFGIGSIILFWFLVRTKRKTENTNGVLLGSSFFFFSINRLVMGESLAVFWILLSFFSFLKKRWLLTGVLWGLAILSKSNAILVLPGLAIGLFIFRKIKFVDLTKALVGLGVMVIASFFLVESMSGKSVLATYNQYSGTDYLAKDRSGVYNNLKSFLKNDIWWRHGAWLIIIPAVLQLFLGKRNRTWVFGTGLIVGQAFLISPFSNQGADHRFLFLWLGFFILFASAKQIIYKFLGFIFIVWQVALIIAYLNAGTYSLRDQSRRIGSFVQGERFITGFFAHEMVMENKLYPLYWAPSHEKFKTINSNVSQWKPDFLLQMLVVDGRNGQVFTPLSETGLGLKQKIVDRIEVLPMSNGTDQIIADLKKIEW